MGFAPAPASGICHEPGQKWVKTYFKAVSAITVAMGGIWFILPQELNPAIAPILGLILVRAWCHSK
ncbi:hypothetical protein [Paraflavitalea speifideaquila]|uniref:hypothetical protein n=1 Tax=Paraflavitalea speifideaquila TaxID=3076558 RepID=UPI0028E8CEAC|nr:hypothetical protein [Paraflavitalea speifideiaquila]